jgi:hypothetical protein
MGKVVEQQVLPTEDGPLGGGADSEEVCCIAIGLWSSHSPYAARYGRTTYPKRKANLCRIDSHTQMLVSLGSASLRVLRGCKISDICASSCGADRSWLVCRISGGNPLQGSAMPFCQAHESCSCVASNLPVSRTMYFGVRQIRKIDVSPPSSSPPVSDLGSGQGRRIG